MTTRLLNNIFSCYLPAPIDKINFIRAYRDVREKGLISENYQERLEDNWKLSNEPKFERVLHPSRQAFSGPHAGDSLRAVTLSATLAQPIL